MTKPRSNPSRDKAVPLLLLAGDTAATIAGLSLGWWLRYASPIARSDVVVPVPGAAFRQYLPLLLVGAALLIGAFAQFGLYDARLVLRRYHSFNGIIKGSTIWFAAYLGISLVLKFDPPISRLFVVLAFGSVIVLLIAWRTGALALIRGSTVLTSLRRRTILLGWNEQAKALADEIGRDPAHPFELVGLVLLGIESHSPFPELAHPKLLGAAGDLEAILAKTDADLVIAARLDLPRSDVARIIETCERAYVDWKIVPAAFDIFLTGLRLQTIGRVPVLGVEELAITRLFNRAAKRGVDLVGGGFGLILSAPVLVVMAALIKSESPGAPALFRQRRVGVGHRLFTLYKLRSMEPLAAEQDDARQSTAREDPRLLRIGAFMRRWNFDELPQFWNVLRGDMSLVGPRPERPHHASQLAQTIPHYQPRHLVKPGMTGWAQVNGLRGESDLAARIQHDIYYIENWSIWLDVQIILLTLVRWRSPNAY